MFLDNSDANHIAHDSADKKTAEISAVENLIHSAVAYAYDDNVEHNKFDYFKYYEAAVKFGEESFHVYFNLGRGKYDGKFHFYDLTNKIRDTAHRINDVGRLRGFLPENGISKDIVPNPSEKSNTSGEKNSPQFSIASDADYLPVAEKYRDGTATEAETEQLRQAVEAAAKKAGYSQRAFHGTENNSGFTTFIGDVYLAVNKDVAETYSGNDGNIYELFVNQKNFFVVEQSDGKSNRRTQGTVLCVLVPL